MLRTPIALGLIAAGSVSFAASVDAKNCNDAHTAACRLVYDAAFVRERNLEIERSIRASNKERAFAAARNREIEASIAATEAWRTKEFVAARNAEITASMARYNATRTFAAARNREIEKSVALVEALRLKEFAAARNREIETSVAAYKSDRALMAFAAARNAESEKVAAAVERNRMKAFAAARNAEIATSLAAYKTERALAAFAAARNAESAKILATVMKQRAQEFALARNREIELSVAAYAADRQGAIITGSINRPAPALNAAAPCRAMESGIGAVTFAASTTELSVSSKAALTKLAALAKVCPGMHIEVHGHTDSSGSAKANKRISQRRAEAVAAYLVGNGIASSRVHPSVTALPRRSPRTIRPRAARRTAALSSSFRIALRAPRSRRS
jgi:outer membrane protein OmpA-like peptidoglycan-associated protein